MSLKPRKRKMRVIKIKKTEVVVKKEFKKLLIIKGL
jgi:hypothetical protein